MLSNLFALTLVFANEQAEMDKEDQRRIDDAAHRYFNSGHLPRKKKKQAKIKAFKDYKFWKDIQAWRKQTLTF